MNREKYISKMLTSSLANMVKLILKQVHLYTLTSRFIALMLSMNHFFDATVKMSHCTIHLHADGRWF